MFEGLVTPQMSTILTSVQKSSRSWSLSLLYQHGWRFREGITEASASPGGIIDTRLERILPDPVLHGSFSVA
jgi:hypothetical protein